MDGTATVTRRTKPENVGSIRAVQPNRCKKAVGHIQILSCVEDEVWQDSIPPKDRERMFAEEAKREGFNTWEGLWGCIGKLHSNNLPKLYRLEFVRVFPIVKIQITKKGKDIIEKLKEMEGAGLDTPKKRAKYDAFLEECFGDK
jgi:hypothetical protein